MANYKEIVTKAVIAKGKKLFTTESAVVVNNKPSTILGCWVINHNFNGVKKGDEIKIDGSYDVNIWYSYDDDTKTEVVKETKNYTEVVHMRKLDEEVTGEEIIVRSLKQPSCVKVDIVDNTIKYVIEKELGIELVGDIKVKIETNLEEDPWEEILDEGKIEDEVNKIDTEVSDNFIDDHAI
ncbi:MAG: outer spore coat protein CotE [bacterium]|nr:outer spore coat protein CotE [bacterium]